MKEKKPLSAVLKTITTYLIYFMLIAFLVSCCMIVFMKQMAVTMQIEYTEEMIGKAAKDTMWNVLFLTVLVTVIDVIRRKYTVEKKAKQISDITKQISEGNFAVRVPCEKSVLIEESFNELIDGINSMAAELESIEMLKKDFISNVSHEMKTPLAVMQNYATMLTEPKLSEEERIEYAQAIMQSSKRLADLVTNILKLNKLENQTIFPEVSVFDAKEQICECLLQFEEIWEEKEIEIKTDLEEEVLIAADAELLCIVWNNLFSNAFKFTEAGGCVSVSLKAVGENAVVKITDNGCGMNAETGAHIFEKFYQGDTSHAGQGNGLGLALVKRIIDITKSSITVESEVGKGTTFTVSIKQGKDRMVKK